LPRTRAAILAILLIPAAALLAFLATGRWLEAALLWSAGAAASIVFRSGSLHGLLYPLDAILLSVLLFLGAADRRRGKLASWKGREMKV
ncbi:MAG TPA: hypothetical protein VFR31_14400, partial [Thermoanaerobaculia bacterium]|nr:hypothetical protein [Thermoanaerobaculia bacterium]